MFMSSLIHELILLYNIERFNCIVLQVFINVTHTAAYDMRWSVVNYKCAWWIYMWLNKNRETVTEVKENVLK